MENRLLSFNEFETLYESFGFIAEAEAPDFTPEKTKITNDDLISLFGGEEVDEALDAKSLKFSVIKKGEKSERVKQLQKDLKDLGIWKSDTQPDGVFGPSLENTVTQFQKDNKISIDGKVGVETLRKMLELKGDKDPNATIEKKYVRLINPTPEQAKEAGIDPELIKLYDVTIVWNGEKQYVILMPKKDTATKIKELKAKGTSFKGFEWLLEGLKYAGKALIYTATGLVVATFEIAKAIIMGIGSTISFLASGTAYVMGAALQGIVSISKWIAKKGKEVYAKVSTKAEELFADFCTGFAKIASKVGKLAVQVFTAFMTVLRPIGYTLTGIALKTFKAIASMLEPAVKAIVQGVKDGAEFIKAGMEWVGKNVKNGAIAIKNGIEAGWKKTAEYGQKAWNGAKSVTKATGEAMYKAAETAYTATANFLSDMYSTGKKAWESLSELTGNPIFESEEFAFEDIDFSIS